MPNLLRFGNDKINFVASLTSLNFYIFKKYSEIEDASTREYMQYFATKKSESEKMNRIDSLVEKYRLDPIAKKAYMTLEQELNIRYNKGVKDGVEIGKEQGVKEGADAKNRELAKGFLEDGVPVEVIAKRTGLSEEEIKVL